MTNLLAADREWFLKIEPIIKAIGSILNPKYKIQNPKVKIVLFSPSGKQFTQKMAQNWAKKFDNLILICGRYEGWTRVNKITKAEEISVGPYILTGGELPAAVVVDAVARHISGVLGKNESFGRRKRNVGVPLFYTKPEIFEYNGKKYRTPKVLLSGHHINIKTWRKNILKRLFNYFKIIPLNFTIA